MRLGTLGAGRKGEGELRWMPSIMRANPTRADWTPLDAQTNRAIVRQTLRDYLDALALVRELEKWLSDRMEWVAIVSTGSDECAEWIKNGEAGELAAAASRD